MLDIWISGGSIFTVVTGCLRVPGAPAGNLPQLRSLHILDGVVTDAAAQQPGLGGWIFLQNYLGRGHSLPQLEELLPSAESHGHLLQVGGHLLQTRLPGQCLRLLLGGHGLRCSGRHLNICSWLTGKNIDLINF